VRRHFIRRLMPQSHSPLKASWRLACLAFALAALVPVRGATAEPPTVPLWEGTPPHYVADATPESIDAAGNVSNVNVPSIAVHLPPRDKATGTAFIVIPGGSYTRVGLYPSGIGTVDYYVPRGIAIIVLKYRTRPPSKDVVNDALTDARRAIRLVRLHAAEWNIDPARVGLVGSSAGAHLILNVSTHWDRGDPQATLPIERQSCRPDFICLLCPWPNQQPIADFPIDRQSPPAFIASARDDQIAPTAFSEAIAAGYVAAGVSHHLWLIDKGGHTAWRIGSRGEGGRWPAEFSTWLQSIAPAAVTKERP